MTYYLYHIPGKKIGITKDLKKRVEEQQGYNGDEYDIILQTDDITIASELEIQYQKALGYRVDEVPYNELKFNNKNSYRAIAIKIDVNDSAIEKHIKSLKEKGILTRVGGTRGHWEVKE